MTGTGFYVDERVFWHCTGVQALFFPAGGWVEPPTGTYGADTPESKRRFANLVAASGLDRHLHMPRAEPATREDLLRVHPARYLDRFKELSDAQGGDLGDVAPFGHGSYEIAMLNAGLAIGAVRDVLNGTVRNAYALCRPGGHHCLPDRPMGFCLLANTAIALEAARAAGLVGRVAIVDWDVHHGNGPQAIYYERDDTLTISVHQEFCFPPGYSGAEERGAGPGLGHNLNIPLPAGCGHDAYLYAFETMVLPALERFRPELIVVASGLDASAVDPLARMLLHSGTYRELTAMMMAAADRLCGGRLCAIHEGGYSEAYVPFCGHAIMETLSGVRSEVEDPGLAFFSAWQPNPRVRAFHRALIDELRAEAGL